LGSKKALECRAIFFFPPQQNESGWLFWFAPTNNFSPLSLHQIQRELSLNHRSNRHTAACQILPQTIIIMKRPRALQFILVRTHAPVSVSHGAAALEGPSESIASKCVEANSTFFGDPICCFAFALRATRTFAGSFLQPEQQ